MTSANSIRFCAIVSATCYRCWQSSWSLVDWLHSNISQWATPDTNHELLLMQVGLCLMCIFILVFCISRSRTDTIFHLVTTLFMQSKWRCLDSRVVQASMRRRRLKSVSLRVIHTSTLLTLLISSKWGKMALWLSPNFSACSHAVRYESASTQAREFSLSMCKDRPVYGRSWRWN